MLGCDKEEEEEEKGERCMTQQRLLCSPALPSLYYGGGGINRLQVNTRANDGDRGQRGGHRSRVRSEQGHEQRGAQLSVSQRDNRDNIFGGEEGEKRFFDVFRIDADIAIVVVSCAIQVPTPKLDPRCARGR